MDYPPAFTCLFRALCLALVVSFAGSVNLRAEGGEVPGATWTSFLANGDFKKLAGDWAEGWERGTEGAISLGSEDGATFVQLTAEQPDQLVVISQKVTLPAGTRGFEFFACFRTRDVKFGKSFVNDARARFTVFDSSGAAIKKGPGDVIFSSHAREWTEISRKYLVPEGAVRLQVTLCLNKPASGTLEVAEVRVLPLDKSEEQALIDAPLVAERQKAEDEAEIQRMAQQPSVTRELKVSGNKLVTATGETVRLQGVNVCSLEWSAKGEQVERSVKVALKEWKANAIRLPVHNGFWFGRGKGKSGPNDAEAYRQIVDQVIKMAAGQGAYVILDLHLYGAPKEEAAEFWKDAAARYANNPAVLFDLYNEPGGISWELWKNGGPLEVKKKGSTEVETVQVVGMQALVDAVRSTGAENLIIAGGINHAYDLSGILTGSGLQDPSGHGIMYATHFYNWHKGWAEKFLALADKYPILVGEFGADVKKMSFVPAKNQESPDTWVPDALGMVQKYGLNWTAFSLHPKATPVLIKDWNYEPTPFWGQHVKAALSGQQFESKQLR